MRMRLPILMKVKLEPNSAQAYIDRGYARFELKQYEAAIADFDEGIVLIRTLPKRISCEVLPNMS